MKRAKLIAVLFSLAVVSQQAVAEPLQEATAAINRKDYAAAVRLIEPLAIAGNPVAQTRLGLLYYHGQGVNESNAQALRWFQRAASQGLAEAQFHLGNMHAYGLAPEAPGEDPQWLAAQWYFQAARQGHVDAQYSLGVLFLTGSGVVQSATEARKWMERAAAQGHVDANLYVDGAGR